MFVFFKVFIKAYLTSEKKGKFFSLWVQRPDLDSGKIHVSSHLNQSYSQLKEALVSGPSRSTNLILY